MRVYKVATEFSIIPSGRQKKDGSATGEHFYEVLVKLLSEIPENDKVIINFDGVLTAGSSFLEESFGGLIRKNNINKKDFNNRILIESNDYPEIKAKISKYVNDATSQS